MYNVNKNHLSISLYIYIILYDIIEVPILLSKNGVRHKINQTALYNY